MWVKLLAQFPSLSHPIGSWKILVQPWPLYSNYKKFNWTNAYYDKYPYYQLKAFYNNIIIVVHPISLSSPSTGQLYTDHMPCSILLLPPPLYHTICRRRIREAGNGRGRRGWPRWRPWRCTTEGSHSQRIQCRDGCWSAAGQREVDCR